MGARSWVQGQGKGLVVQGSGQGSPITGLQALTADQSDKMRRVAVLQQTSAVVVEHGGEDVGIAVEEQLLRAGCSCSRCAAAGGGGGGSDGVLDSQLAEPSAGPASQRAVARPERDSAHIQCHRRVTERVAHRRQLVVRAADWSVRVHCRYAWWRHWRVCRRTSTTHLLSLLTDRVIDTDRVACAKRLCNGRVSVRLSVCLSIDSGSDMQLSHRRDARS